MKYRERDLQVAVAAILDLHERAGHCVYLHVPNEGRRSKWHGAELKRQGLKPGAPDFIVWLPKGQYGVWWPVLCIELKSTRGILTDAQRKFSAAIHRLNHNYHIVKAATPDEAVRQVCELCGLDPDIVRRAA
jgi:VRR-NUC domain